MLSRRAFLCLVAALAAGGCGSRRKQPMYVEDQSISEVSDGPPAPKTEIQPAKPDGDVVWIGGRWKWQDDAWVWSAGRWVNKPYRNAIWVAGRWQQRGRTWMWVPGHWI
jgi:hypothetical protein